MQPKDAQTDIIMKDVTIIHDKSHPDYSSMLEMRYTQSVTSVHHGRDDVDRMFYAHSGGDLTGNPAKRRRMGSANDDAVYLASAAKFDAIKRPSSLSQSWPGSSLTGNRGLSGSWPGRSPAPAPAPKEKKVDLTALSPSTLKLLSQGDLSKFVNKPVTPKVTDPDDELKLTQIVDRLNSAAAKNTKKSRSSRDGSVDGSRHSRESK